MAIGFKAQAMQESGLVNLKPPDAIHLASALRAEVVELHSFDDKILNLNEVIGGVDSNPLRICKPTEGQPLGPLFDASLDKANDVD